MSTTATKIPSETDYLAISASMLVPSKLCGVAIYSREHSQAPIRLFRGAGYPITQVDLDRLITAKQTKLYVTSLEHEKFQKYLRENLNEFLADESLGVHQRFGMLNEVVRDVLGESFAAGDCDHTVLQTQQLSRKTVDMICREDAVATELCGVLYHDYHTFTHSANVAFYCVMLAKSLGVTDKQELNQIATGALLHDLGKLGIPEAVLTKPGKLTDHEFELIQRHPMLGFVKLCGRDDLNIGQLMMVYQHHERMNGSGYPVGVSSNEIHPWARICMVADVYEALTSHRPYRRGMTAEKAFSIMDRDGETCFDRDVYECWKANVKQH